MADRPDNEKGKNSRDTISDLSSSWDELLSGFKNSDDIEIHSLEDLGLDSDGIDFSSIPDADDRSPRRNDLPELMNYHSKTKQFPRSGFPVSDLPDFTDDDIPADDTDIQTSQDENSFYGIPAEHTKDKQKAPAADARVSGPPAEEISKDNGNDTGDNDNMAENTNGGPAVKKNYVKKKKKKHRFIGFILKLILLLIAIGVAFVAYIVLTTPMIDTSNIYENISQSSVIYDDQGEVLESVATSENRTNVDYSEMPSDLVYAFVSVEDKTFFTHKGFNLVRILGAVKDSIISHDQISGTSTITQQLARNIYLTRSRTITRKVREAVYTIILEKQLSKEQIIEAYLNTINLGFGSYGVQAAAQAYFGCDVQDLTIAQCATLASIPKSPTKYAPLKRYESDQVEADNPDILLEDSGYVVVYDDTYKDRQEMVLRFMNEQGYITDEEYQAALAEDIKSELKPSPLSSSQVSSYFADYCVSEVIDDLVEEFSMDEEAAKDLVYSQGVRIYSTLNVDMQKAAEEEFSNTSNFPGVTGLKKDKNGNIISDSGSIMLYSKSTYFNDDGTFTLSSDEYSMNDSGDLIILAGHRLNIYMVTGSSGDKVPQIEFKNLYTIKDSIFYSINGGYWAGIDEKYLSRDDDGNAVISAEFLEKNPDYFIIGDSTVSIGPAHYTLHQETIQPQSAMVVTDYTNGQIKVMVGGRSLSGRLLYNRATNTRQPGSAIKPLAVYGPALQSGVDLGTGWTAGSTIEDSENIENGEVWPKNSYSGYKGWVTLRTCVEQSINVCSVRLLKDIGITYAEGFLEKNGITSVVKSGDTNDMNLAALALGGMTNGISPIEMASAYGTFPNGGVYTEPCSYTKVTDSDGNVILEKTPETTQVFDEGVAFIMTDILQTTVTNGIAGRAAIGTQPVGGKTGTTSDNIDAWFCGFTPQFSAALWIGNDINIELSSGSGAAAALWSKVMKRVCEGYSYGSFRSRPSNVYVGSDGEYYVTGTSKTGPYVGGSSAAKEEHEILTDEEGKSYYLDDDGNKVYVDENGEPTETGDGNVEGDTGGTTSVPDTSGGQTSGGETGGSTSDSAGGSAATTPEQPVTPSQPSGSGSTNGLVDDPA